MAESNGNEPATRANLQAVGDYLHADMQRLEDRLIQVLTCSQAEFLEKMQGIIRDAQTELLQAFERAADFEGAAGFVTLRKASIENPPWDTV
jgi:hypothetical protein